MITPRHFLDLSTSLISSSIDECNCRSSASRAYYAAFHLSRISLPKEFEVTKSDERNKGSHQVVIDKMEAWGRSALQGRTSAKQVARLLPRLKAARIIADYHINEHFNVDKAQTSVLSASRIFKFLENNVELNSTSNE